MIDVPFCFSCVQYRRDTDGLLQFLTFDALQRVQNILARVITQSARRSSAAALSRCLSRYTGYPCVSVLLTNRQLYASRQDRHRHQRTSSHCSYHTFPLSHCGEATHRGWPFVELEQFLPVVLSLSLHRPFGAHCWTLSSTRTRWQL